MCIRDSVKVEEVHPSVEFNRRWAAREKALDSEPAELERVGIVLEKMQEDVA